MAKTHHRRKGEHKMSLVMELLLIGIGLSMDAFAVAVCKGLAMRKVNKKQALIIGLFFGGFQALMPFLGWALGTRFESYITNIDHWIAFILLAFIGGKMVIEAVKPEEYDEIKQMDPPLDLKEIFILAVATSIDALAANLLAEFKKFVFFHTKQVICLHIFLIYRIDFKYRRDC